MKTSQGERMRWVVVKVERGIPTELKLGRSLAWARRTERTLLRSMDEQYDEVGVFAVDLEAATAEQITVGWRACRSAT